MSDRTETVSENREATEDLRAAGIHPLFSALAAIAIVVSIIGGYLWVTYKPPVHTGQIVSVAVYPIHRELSTGTTLGGVSGAPNVYDELIVIVNAQIRSQTQLPLFLNEMYGELTLADGETQESRAAGATDFHKVFVAYPVLAPQQKAPMPRNITMTPGQVVNGQMIFHYPITEQQWNARKSFDVSVRFINQDSLVLHTGPGSAGGSH
jgi:hypothetical protein